MTIAARYRSQDGRYSAHAEYKGWSIEIATAYSIDVDAYPVVVYAAPVGRQLERVGRSGPPGSTKDEALDIGLAFAQAHVDEQAQTSSIRAQ